MLRQISRQRTPRSGLAGGNDCSAFIVIDAENVAVRDNRERHETDFDIQIGVLLIAHIVLEPKEALRAAKTVAITKSTLNPSRQALEYAGATCDV